MPRNDTPSDIIFLPDLPAELAQLGVVCTYQQVWMRLVRQVVPTQTVHRRMLITRKDLPVLAASLRTLLEKNERIAARKSANG